MTATVIIPTTGSCDLETALRSTNHQSYQTNVCVVVDGIQHQEKVDKLIGKFDFDTKNVAICTLPENVGSDGFYGHRVYAAFTHLVNSKYVLYLDQDCWMDNNHVQTLVDEIEANEYDWAYSLRKIVDKEGNYLFNDDCESLGLWKPIHPYNHVDTNCYCIKTEVAIKVCQIFHGKWGQDRIFYQALSQHFQRFGCSGLYTMNYRLGGNDSSVSMKFFEEGNRRVESTIGNYPWRKNAKN